MTTNTTNITSTVDSLIGAYRSHVSGRALLTPVSVQLTADVQEIAVQPGGDLDLRSRLSNLLLWAYTLAHVTANWWHTPQGSLHITVHGRTGCGTRMKVYGGAPFTECLDLVQLAPGESENVSLDELFTLLGLLGDAQHDREAA